ncbi:heterokaryon incompatibility protein-domain-containing protein [Fusarium flagelliforme]|uniref:Heterokaryon incompatibility protein-domain-containing protein n=1 Tax=Fusarium flagelliforme TaxID=2675880 RepID=A0A395MJG1_9HYPO|nr:heterokaryon incompatibility protein-domain-containing protein [Fusarium flagelliforme]
MGKLCRYCAIIVSLQTDPEVFEDDRLHSIDAYAPVRHHEYVQELIDSAETCLLCDFIRHSWSLPKLLKRYPDIREEDYKLLELEFKLTNAVSAADHVSCNFLGGDIIVPWYAFADSFKVTITTCRVSSKASENPIWDWREPSKEDKIKTIKSWYTNCVSQHAECKPSSHGYPRRLVQIGPEKENIRLVDTLIKPEERPEYATLSYCWGASRPFVSTKGNIGSFLQSIPRESLPQTFHDAIDIIWELGLRYIWIDSLCIVQDDLEDWRREAACMKDVYAGSSVTISASDAQDSTQGCFTDLDLNLWEGHGVAFEQVGARFKDQNVLIRLHQGDIRRRTKFANLSTRGWTLQEQLLSHRVIHCMQPEIHWNCHHSYHSESQVTFEAERFRSFSWKFFPHDASIEDMKKLWLEWITDYSKRNLTVTRDRLAALAGMVQYFRDRTGFKHLLGCWHETLIDELLWIRFGETTNPSNTLTSMPSWSWLTRVGTLDLSFWSRSMGNEPCDIEDHINIVEADITWTGEPMVSDISSSTMIIEGPTREMRLRLDPRSKRFNPRYFNVNDEEPDFREGPMPWRCSGMFDVEDDRDDNLFTCLLVRSVTLKTRDFLMHRSQETCLILVPVDSEGTAYRRVGIVMFRGAQPEFTSAETKIVQLL